MSLSQRNASDARSNVAAVAGDDHAWITLVQTSGKCMRFRGTWIAEASSYTSSTPMWHVINLYCCSASRRNSFVVSVRIHQKSANVEDKLRVFKVATLEAVMDLIEQYTPENDVQSGMTAAEVSRFSPVEAALHSTKMQHDISQVRRHYDAMTGDFLFRIGALKLS